MRMLSFVIACIFVVSCSSSLAQENIVTSEQNLIDLILKGRSPDVLIYRADPPFVLKSGELSTVFLNMGNITQGKSIAQLGDIYADAIVKSGLKFDVIFGSAYKGIPLAVTIARSLYEKYGLDYPYAFNRKESKDHGEGGDLVGADMAGKNVLIVDDVITTGKATRESMRLIEKAGGKAIGLIVSVDRTKEKAILKGDIPVIGITTLKNIMHTRDNKKRVEENTATKKIDTKIIVALDVNDRQGVEKLVSKLDPTLCKLKVGLQLFMSEGPNIVRYLNEKGFDVFLDLKYLDIPNTVYQAVWQAAELNVWMLTVHASGTKEMLSAAHRAVSDFAKKYPHKRTPKIMGVTILTSVSESDLKSTYVFSDMQDAVLKLARKVKEHHLDGIVCSVHEAKLIKTQPKLFGSDFVVVTPGIRLDKKTQDQVRVATPQLAIQAGSDYLVIGRPITQAVDVQAALSHFLGSIKI